MTHKTINFLKQKDKIMISLKNIQNNYYNKPIEPIIKDNTFIPGLNGFKINIDKSYNRLKKVGSFNKQLLVYDTIKTKEKISNNKDKYIISGNPKKNMVSILLYLDNIKEYDVDTKLNYIVNYNTIINKDNLINQLIDKGNNIVITNTSESNIKKIKLKQNNYYCFNENFDNNYLNICKDNNFYTIKANIINNNHLNTIKKNLTPGSLIVLKGNYDKELNLIINYIKSKGYNITNLDTHLSENI